jgi:hypothetical protein
MATPTQPPSLMCVIICGWRKTSYPSNNTYPIAHDQFIAKTLAKIHLNSFSLHLYQIFLQG